MNVLLVDDHEIVWNGTRRLIERVAAEVDPSSTFGFEAVCDVASACRLPAPRCFRPHSSPSSP